MSLLAFMLVALGIIVIPGPNVLVIVATTLEHGRLRGLQTVLGTSCAMAIQLLAAALATSMVVMLAQGLIWLKWVGVAYLVYLGIMTLSRASNTHAARLSANGSFWRGFLVSLINPKTCLFFAAFLPQFVHPEASYGSQILVLSIVFWALALASDSGYALVISRLTSTRALRILSTRLQRAAGVTYVAAGVALAMTRISRQT